MADEQSIYYPSPEASKNAYIKNMEEYEAQYKRSIEDPEGYWAECAEESLTWTKKWDTVLDYSWDPTPTIKWFEGGELNVTYNCLDRHVEAGKGGKTAVIFESDQGDNISYTYQELLDEVCKFANVLKKHGVEKGDRVAVYLPMISEVPIVLLACARIGAVHMVVFGGFSADSLRARIDDCEAKVLVCADKGYRGGRIMASKTNADDAISGETLDRDRDRHQARRRRRADAGRPRRLVPGRDGRRRHHDRLPGRAVRVRTPALHPLHLRLHRQAQGRPAHHCRLPPVRARDGEVHVQPARGRHPFLRRGRRLGDGSQLHRLRPAVQRGHHGRLREHPELPRAGPLLAGHRQAQDDDAVHSPDRHPQPRRPGRRVAAEAPHVQPAHHRHRRRTHRPQQLEVVLRQRRQGQHPALSTRGGRPRRAAT